MDTTTKTYRVPEQNLDVLKHRMAKLVRRCNRVKIDAPVLTVGAFEDIKYVKDGRERVRRVYNVTLVSAGRPKINGYEFAAVLSPTVDESGKVLGNVLRRVPGFEVEIPLSFRTAANYCDHCKTSRHRLETFVIHSDAGFRQIGRNCLANYLGLTDPDALVSIAEMLIDADDLCELSEDSEGFGGGSYVERVTLEDVLSTAASAIRLYGWLSNKSAREFEKTSTSTRVSSWIFGNAKTREQFEHPLVVTDEDNMLAADTMEWLETLSTMDMNEYIANLALLAKSVSVTGKNFGIACSAISAFSREREREIRRNARIESDKNSEFVGEIGVRRMFENVIVVYTNSYESDFGVSYLYKMKMGENVLSYFSSRELGWAQGDTISFKASVKEHELYQGVKQTVVTRAVDKATLEAIEVEKAAKKVADKADREMKKFMKSIAWG